MVDGYSKYAPHADSPKRSKKRQGVRNVEWGIIALDKHAFDTASSPTHTPSSFAHTWGQNATHWRFCNPKACQALHCRISGLLLEEGALNDPRLSKPEIWMSNDVGFSWTKENWLGEVGTRVLNSFHYESLSWMTPLESYGTKMWMEHKSQTFKIATLHKPSVCTNLSGVSRENILSSVRNDGGRAGLTSTGLDTHGIARDLGHTACSGVSFLSSLLIVNELMASKEWSLVLYVIQHVIDFLYSFVRLNAMSEL